jgi:hypothetical protein
MAQLGPRDVDVLQAYENFTGGVLLGMVEHGMVSAEEANEFMVPENLRFDTGRLPLNTSGATSPNATCTGSRW